MPIDLLLRLVNRERPVIDETRVPATLHDMGIEVDEVTSTNVYGCAACENVIERTDAQGEPTNCAKCGCDFREKPQSLLKRGVTRVARLDMLAVRPDIFDAGGMARYMRGFLGVQTGLIEYAVAPAKYTVNVDPRLARDESYRPFIACAVLRDVRLDDERIKLLMNLQEDLHWALGRDRKLASIGVYDLDKLAGPEAPFVYEATPPDSPRFVPLGFSPADPAAKLSPREILERHKTGQAYAHLLGKHIAYPLLRDGKGNVLSMPPIINSEATRVMQATRNCFCDVTGLSQRTVDRALNILVTNLMEVIPTIQIEGVTISGEGGSRVTPDLKPGELTLGVQRTSETIGIALDTRAATELLERMGHGVSSRQTSLAVRVPSWRNDIMHPVDLIEDAAIAYGYQNLVPQLIPTFTVGTPREIEEQSAVARRIFTGLGFHQVMTLTLSNETLSFERWGVPHDPRAVRIENPISVEQTICRTSLLPGILETLSLNKQYELPQHLFEVGDCCFVDKNAETGAREERYVAAAMIGPHVGYADIRAVGDAFLHEMEAQMEIRAVEHPGFIAGRVAGLFLEDRRLGTMGEVHPRGIESSGLRHAIAVLELNLTQMAELRNRRGRLTA
jgi:phenylalanyl-tRNA synthetase beta chain